MLPLLAAIAFTPVQQPQLPTDGVAFEAKVTRSYRMNYLLRLPDNYDGSKKVPLLIFRHCSGERGNNLDMNRVHGPFKELAKSRKFPFIIVAPQCPEGQSWDGEVLNLMLKGIGKKYRVDKDRIYLTGLSMGGYGTSVWATANPEKFAAIAPICGGGDPTQASRLVKIPTWVTHGDKDGAVPIAQSISMVNALKAAGGDVRFDIIPGGQHDVGPPSTRARLFTTGS